MKELRLVQDYLRDILEARDKAENFITGLDLHTFAQDDKSAFAVIRCFEIIGEAAMKIPVNIRKQFADIPWQSLAGMWNKLIHDYTGVSLEVVWQIIKEDIPIV
ncbi:MAG: DUF86 domain-containing protein [Desulfobulbaceae bacterium]|nr:DUF86 domain-containing protein [Desulfobulbaceae bacterium]